VVAARLNVTMETILAASKRTLPPVPRPVDDEQAQQEAAQQFVTRLRAAAALFASAAGAQTAVVREAVPPARHRRSRCRVVLCSADGSEVDLTLLGPAGRPRAALRLGFDRQIQRWLAAGAPRDPAWLVPDTDAPDGVAVDVAAWVSVG
jgi:hypothetical protein